MILVKEVKPKTIFVTAISYSVTNGANSVGVKFLSPPHTIRVHRDSRHTCVHMFISYLKGSNG